jgi:Zn-dependent protease
VTVAGIDVYVHGTFLLLAIFTTVVLHEFGHALTARRFCVRTQDIMLLPIGGVARLDKMPDKPGQQLLVAFAGPAVNLAIAFAIFVLLFLGDGRIGIESFRHTDVSFLAQLMWINVSLAVFNLLPGYPMYGGRIIYTLLAMSMPPERATQTAARVGQGVAMFFGLVGFFVSPLLILIAVFVWLGAQAEHSVSTVRVALAGLSVRHGMITDFKTVAPTDPLSRAVEQEPQGPMCRRLLSC